MIKVNSVRKNYNIITHKYNQILFSYQTPVAVITSNGNIYKTKQKYSVTTSRHINKFLEGLESEEVDQNFIDSYTI
jgi:hypothetical protein